MVTNTQEYKPKSNSVPSNSSQSRQKLIAVAAIVIVALLAINAWLLYSYTNANKAQASLTTQLDEANVIQEELNESYYKARAELETLKGKSVEQDAIIEQKEAELLEQKDRIASLLRKGGSLEAARAELKQLNQKVDSYLAELNGLREQNALLSDENVQLAAERNQFSTDLTTQQQTNTNLNEENNRLAEEQQKLVETNEELDKIATSVKAIQVDDLKILGQKRRRSGQLVTRRNAENVEQLTVSFALTVNDYVAAGMEKFIVRIINAQGETLALNKLGSGVFKSETTGEEMRYTKMASIDYEKAIDYMLFEWEQGQGFSSGKYSVEVYNKGYLVGTSDMVLR